MAQIAKLIPMFGSVSEIARIAGAARSTVSRWQKGTRPIRPTHQRRLMREAAKQNLNVEVVADALDVPKCPHCGKHHIVR